MGAFRRLFGRAEERVEPQGPLYAAVRDAMFEVQAYARTHGGEIVLVAVTEDGDVHLQMAGACRGCPMSAYTIKHGVESQLKILVPGVRKIVQVK